MPGWIQFVILPMLCCVGPLAHARITGTTSAGAPGVTENISVIMAREAMPGRPPFTVPRAVKPVHIRTNGLPQNPSSPAAASWPLAGAAAAGAATAAGGPYTPQTVGTSFLGAQVSDTIGYVPPDSMADVGTNQILVCVNGRIRSFSKDGVADGALDATTDNFFASVLGGSSTSDPRVRFDRLSGRWFITMITVNTPNFVLLAVSSGPAITSASSFTFYSFPADASHFGDYDTLGVDAHALYIGVNVFNGNTFVNSTGFVVNKASLLAGALQVTTFTNLINGANTGPFTPQGVNNDDPVAAEGYFIGVDDAVFGQLDVIRVSNPGGTPSLSGVLTVAVPATYFPLGGVPAAGSTIHLDDLDDRLFATRMHGGSLWTAHNIRVGSSGVASRHGNRDGSRWYQITNLTGTPTLAQSGTLFDTASSSPRNFWIPSCAMSGQGHMALGCSVAGNTEHAEIATAGRLASDAAGTIRSPTTAVTTTSTYNLNDGSNPHRWGDFSVTTVDPADDMTFWTVQEYCNANDSWGVRVIKLLAPPPAVPVSCNPNSVTAGVTHATLVVSGFSNNGSGFFDPGVGYPNRISAAISGTGAAVNSVTYNNPTNITLDVSISPGATAGLRAITVTNPDGQNASGPGLLTIISSATNQPPVLAGISNRTIYELTTLTFTNTATDADGDTLTFSLDPGAPTNAVLNPTNGIFSWTPTEAQGPGTNTTTVRVTDNGSPPLSATQSFTVIVLESNLPPTLTPIASQITYPGLPVIFTNSATDPDIPAQILTFSLDPGAPSGAAVNATNGIFSWTPDNTFANTTNDITVRVTDSGSPPLNVTQSFTIIVLETNLPPVLAPIASQITYPGLPVIFTNSATDPDIPAQTLTFSLDPGAPSGAAINPTNGIFSWTPDGTFANTTNDITVRVTDNGSPPMSDARTFQVGVVAPLQLDNPSGLFTNGEITISWNAISGLTYRVQYQDDIGGANWNDLLPDVPATNSTASKTDSVEAAPARYYRVRTPP